MAGRLRFVFVALFVALYFLIPRPDRDHLAFLGARAWLLSSGEQSPLAASLATDGAVRPLRLQAEPPLPQDSPVGEGDYQRLAREWARKHAEGRIAETGDPLLLTVRQGTGGADLELSGTGLAAPHAHFAAYPDRTSLLPAFLAIVLALLFGKVVPALLIGCLAGVLVETGSLLGGVQHFAVDIVWHETLVDAFRVHIMGFVVFLFAAVGVMTRSGGIQGMVLWIRRFARGPISTQLCSYLVGLLIFFDDYSNCVIAGSTMRPLTDRNRVSREKLAYIVDSTAAPIAGLSLVSTWIAYEVSTFSPQLPEVTRPDGSFYAQSDGFSIFVQTLPYRFYCIITLAMVAMTILLRREFGPMLRAERRALHDGKPVADDARPMVSEGLTRLDPPEGARLLARNALLPVLLLVGGTIALMLWRGIRGAGDDAFTGPLLQRMAAILDNAHSEEALCYASAVALLFASALAVGQRILTPRDTAHAAVRSASSLIFAVVILVLAWSIGSVCKHLGTDQFLTAAFQSRIPAHLLPMLLFALAALVSFSTGTSYGTMAILLPNVVVLAHSVGATVPELGGTALMVLTIGAVLEGSIFGDHCSPISDTTVLSSVASGSDHLHHVQTQAPYAVLGMLTALTCGYLPCALLGPQAWWLAFVLSLSVVGGFLLVFGRRP